MSVCKMCGTSHKKDECPATNFKCVWCDKLGHYSKLCYFADKDLEKRQETELNELCRIVFDAANIKYGKNVIEDELEERMNKALEIRLKSIKKQFKRLRDASKVELCFLLDITGSMDEHMDEVHKSIKRIVNYLLAVNKNPNGIAKGLRLAFVGYRDFGDEEVGLRQIETLNFTESIKQFETFVGNLKADGGGFDGPEDVFGGLEAALTLDWQEDYGTKVIFHLADYPCHGKKYHDRFDNYPNGDPKGRTEQQLFSQIRRKQMQYCFGRITEKTDGMIEIFSQVYGQRITEFNMSNVESLFNSVTIAVKTSVTTNIEKEGDLTLTDREGEPRIERNYTLDEAEPDWNHLTQQIGNIITYKYPTLKEITKFEILKEEEYKKESPEKKMKMRFKIAMNPFAKGGDRLAYFGRDETYSAVDEIVLKEYISDRQKDNTSKLYKVPTEISTVAKFFAARFNKKLLEAKVEAVEITFLKIRTLKVYDAEGKSRYLCVEPRFRAPAKFVKFTNNANFAMSVNTAKENGIDLKFVQMLMAFSHFTFEESDGYLMIVDLQGVISHDNDATKDKQKITLTDPAIHCKNLLRFSKTNGGEDGMNLFFEQHICNLYCKALGLRQQQKLI